ncbi:MAG: PEP-CTERM sorting domain-containing protein [Planctomycetaceae bacterium]|nr:MAG: PEP-CTERM sorting domain-containing protein [Planctomycetaceae bacterium]
MILWKNINPNRAYTIRVNSYGFYDLPVWDVFGVGTNVPEPASMTLLMFGGMALFARRARRPAGR